jgi:type IV pilus assembly protein PilC
MSARFFTPMVVNMVAIGEEAGNLEEMLREISLHYDAEVEYATRRLTTALGPALIAMLAIMVGFFALAVYLPMWDMARIVTHAE